MFLLATKMYPASDFNTLSEKQQKLIKRCCDNQLQNLVSAGQSIEDCIKMICSFVWQDQLPSIAAFAGEEFDIPAKACIIDIARVNDMAPNAGIFPDDWEDKLFKIGSFYLDGTPV